ncbi:MAG: isoaspartyl peptidase/L-asparaginase [Desulfobacterales bacterium]|nr:isoaspartyl peptidase/L-asparaginase [Desulfobacterales bacterium]
MTRPYTLLIHGGCEGITKDHYTPESQKAHLEALGTSLAAGRRVLDSRGHAVDAVLSAVRVLEDCPLFNAGRGSVFTRAGRIEMDASVMNGENLGAGAVAGITCIKNPVLAAGAVMKKSAHVLLMGTGAEAFCKKQGLEKVDPKYFHTVERKKEHLAGKALKGEKYGTVGAVCIDGQGNLAAATSTGGITNKQYGRVGDSPIIGAGVYADNSTCAVSCTGQGELFLRRVAAHRVSALMAFKQLSLADAVAEVLESIRDLGGKGGMIAVDRTGQVCLAFTTRGMFRGLVREHQPARVAMFGPPGTWA